MMAALRYFSRLMVIISLATFHLSVNAYLFNGQPYDGSPEQIQELQSIASASRAKVTNATLAQPASNVTASVRKHDNTSDITIASARAVVASAIAQQRIVNKARVENPLRNTYKSRHSSSASTRRAADSPPLVLPSPNVAAAAALVAEVDAAAEFKNGTLYKDYSSVLALGHRNRGAQNVTKRETTSFWMEGVEHLGTQPLGNDPSYKVSLESFSTPLY